MNIQDAVMGTDNPRDLLLAAGVQAFRLQAGYVAPVMTGEGVLPQLTFAHAENYALFKYTDDGGFYVGRMAGIVLECKLCYDCCYGFECFYDPHVRFWSRLVNNECCECCGKLHIKDDIPF